MPKDSVVSVQGKVSESIFIDAEFSLAQQKEVKIRRLRGAAGRRFHLHNYLL